MGFPGQTRVELLQRAQVLNQLAQVAHHTIQIGKVAYGNEALCDEEADLVVELVVEAQCLLADLKDLGQDGS